MSSHKDTVTSSPSASDVIFPTCNVVLAESTLTPESYQGDRVGVFQRYSKSSDTRILGEHCPSQGSATSRSSQNAHLVMTPPHTLHSPTTSEPSIDKARRCLLKEQDVLGGIPLRCPAIISRNIGSIQAEQTGSNSRSTSVMANCHAASGPDPSARGLSSGAVGGIEQLVGRPFEHTEIERSDGNSTGAGRDTVRVRKDEPVHTSGAIQRFGALVAIESNGHFDILPARIVSENSRSIIGKTPDEIFALDSFTDIFAEGQANNLRDHINLVKEQQIREAATEPQVFTVELEISQGLSRMLWCAVNRHHANPDLIICEFELKDDQLYPFVPPTHLVPEAVESTLDSKPTLEEYFESTQNKSRPLRVPRSVRERTGGICALDALNVLSQVQEQLEAALDVETLLRVLVGIVKSLTGFHRVMICRFDQAFNGRVVTELVDPRVTKDLYKGLNFPASDMFEQAKELCTVNKVRVLYDRELEAARLIYRTMEDLQDPLDLAHSYLRAFSQAHLGYLGNMAVRSSMSISIEVFDKPWGLIVCHSYGPHGMRAPFPTRKMCRLVVDSASKAMERLSYASRLQASGLINTVSTETNPSGYIAASSEDLLKLFDADFALISLGEETKLLGHTAQPQEALAMLEYLRLRKAKFVIASTNIKQDFPDLRYAPSFRFIAGILLVPFSGNGTDFIVFFRKTQIKEIRWAGYTYEHSAKEGTEGCLQSRKTFGTWSEMGVAQCCEWTEQELETAAVLCLVYGKFIKIWRQKEAALQSSRLTKLLLANSAHEIRTPLNAVINYLEIALESNLDQETRDSLVRSHVASKAFLHVISDLLDLTRKGGNGLLVNEETFDLEATLREATDIFRADAKRKNISYDVILQSELPEECIGDQRLVRRAVSRITAKAFQNTNKGGVKVEVCIASRPSKDHIEIEVAVTDTGDGMSSKALDQLLQDIEQKKLDLSATVEDALIWEPEQLASQGFREAIDDDLAVTASVIRSMNGQLRLRSEEGKGSQFMLLFPFDLPVSGSGDVRPTYASWGCRGVQAKDVWGPPEKVSERVLVSRNPFQNLSARSSKAARNVGVENLRGINSDSSNSQKSSFDKLIEIIQEPHLVNERPSILRNTTGV
jgi:light-regulated signal transduction histidine kinase (bacteriophytochrome)